MKTLTSALLAMLIAGASTFAFAHGDDAHAKKAVAVKKEQKEWGIAGDAKAVQRTIAVGMSDDMRFTPGDLAVKQGETIRFVIKNTGKVMHEMVIGTKKENDEHAALMIKFPGMEHDAPYMAHVAPGKTSEIIWTFNKPGNFDFACLIAGHYQAGMVGKIKVAAR
ncbi:MAG: cupredoxin family protein [Polaromonas sp.]|nr:cupredoxin family protein [Polaromonas sp.]